LKERKAVASKSEALRKIGQKLKGTAEGREDFGVLLDERGLLLGRDVGETVIDARHRAPGLPQRLDARERLWRQRLDVDVAPAAVRVTRWRRRRRPAPGRPWWRWRAARAALRATLHVTPLSDGSFGFSLFWFSFCSRVKHRTLFLELAGFFFHSLLKSFLFGDALLRRIFPHALRDLHAAKVWAAHGTSSFTKAMAR